MLERDGFQSKVPTPVIEQAVGNLNVYITANYGDPNRGTLKASQMTVFEDLRDTLSRGQTEGYVHIPTGVGKTVLFIEFIKATKLSTLIVVPTTILVGQTGDKFQEFAPDVEIGMLYSRKHDLTRPVTITTYASLVRNINNGTLDPHLFQLLVLDEVHRSLSQKRKLAVIAFGESIKLGFTATPVYSKDRQVANLLNTEVHKMSVREAIEQDLLSPFSAYIAESDVDLSNVSITSIGDYNQKELELAINIASRNQAAIDLYQQLFPGQTAVAYCVSIKHAQELASLFNESGVTAGYISGIQSKKEQEELLRQFKNGQIRVLCNADILIEGFDEPKASVCLNVRPTRSVVVAQQRAGRVLRLDPDNPNKHACVVDFLDKTQDPRKQPVTFAEVAEAAIILSRNEGYGGSGGRGRYGPIVDSVIQISGLRVTINPEEVLRIVKEIQEKKFLMIQAGDFLITHKNLRAVFRGDESIIVSTAKGILRRLLIEHPDLVFKRYASIGHKNHLVEVITDRGMFIQEMSHSGIELKEPAIQEILDTDIVISADKLSLSFVGSGSKLVKIGREIAEQIKRERPDLIVKRRSGTISVTAVTDRYLFTKLMLERGIQKKPETNPIEESTFIINSDNLTKTFTGSRSALLPKVNRVMLIIKQEYPDTVVQIRTGSHYVEAVTNKQLFITLMISEGARLKDTTLEEPNDNDFLVIIAELEKYFKGSREKKVMLARTVLASLELKEPALITKRRRSRATFTVVTDKERFIQEMLNLGAELK